MPGMQERLRQLRKSLDLTQLDFAKSLGVSRSHIANLEAGNTEPSEHLLLLICEKNNVNIEWLKYGTGPMMIAPEAQPEKRAIQEMLFSRIQNSIQSSLHIIEMTINSIIKDINDAMELDPTLCPPSLYHLIGDELDKMKKIKERQVVRIIRRALDLWEEHVEGKPYSIRRGRREYIATPTSRKE